MSEAEQAEYEYAVGRYDHLADEEGYLKTTWTLGSGVNRSWHLLPIEASWYKDIEVAQNEMRKAQESGEVGQMFICRQRVSEIEKVEA